MSSDSDNLSQQDKQETPSSKSTLVPHSIRDYSNATMHVISNDFDDVLRTCTALSFGKKEIH